MSVLYVALKRKKNIKSISMKHLLPLCLIALLGASSCSKDWQAFNSAFRRISNTVELKPEQRGEFTSISFKVDSLYDNRRLKNVCPVAYIKYDISALVPMYLF